MSEQTKSRRLRLGMVGGGHGAFIGAVHRMAARLDDNFELVAGSFDADPARGRDFADGIGIDPDRAYGSYEEMAAKEAAREDGVDAVSIVTPNFLHFAVAKVFVEAGFNVFCEKPMTTSLEDAEELAALVGRSGKVFVLTHNYTAYPMVRQAREMIRAGDLGAIRVVQAEYAQDWLSQEVEATGNPQAEWRTDPAKAGVGGAIGDVGTHAFNLVSFVTGLKVESLSAELTSFVKGRRVDDDAQIRMRFAGGAKGALWACQIAPGNENALRLRVFGEKGGLEWCQEDSNDLWHTPLGEPKRLITRSGAGAGPAAARVSRVPGGHPEGYIEGFASIYAEGARAIRSALEGAELDESVVFPTVHDGVAGVRFIEACVESSRHDAGWVTLAAEA